MSRCSCYRFQKAKFRDNYFFSVDAKSFRPAYADSLFSTKTLDKSTLVGSPIVVTSLVKSSSTWTNVGGFVYNCNLTVRLTLAAKGITTLFSFASNIFTVLFFFKWKEFLSMFAFAILLSQKRRKQLGPVLCQHLADTCVNCRTYFFLYF